jgi:hypothetical protein
VNSQYNYYYQNAACVPPSPSACLIVYLSKRIVSMKGIVFTEFLDMVEDRFGLETADQIIEDSQLPSKGAYTSIGTYNHTELEQLLTNLSKKTGISIPDLLKTFGQSLFESFVKGFPQFFENVFSSFSLLQEVEGYIHQEVKKLYPDAELPKFETVLKDNNLTMIYRSDRGLSDLAEGLILGCINHYDENINLQKEDLSNGQGKIVRFLLTKQ